MWIHLFLLILIICDSSKGDLPVGPDQHNKVDLFKSTVECVDRNNVTIDDFQSILQLKFGIEGDLPHNLDCFMGCLQKKSGLVSEGNHVNYEKLKKELELVILDETQKQQALFISNHCYSQIKFGDNDCTIGKNLLKCYRDYIKYGPPLSTPLF